MVFSDAEYSSGIDILDRGYRNCRIEIWKIGEVKLGDELLYQAHLAICIRY